ncbi:MAG: electron transport complex subunit RsxE, partial [Gammaproteobacteria bacterium]|nr:electron transport complex subunit RsxE [Gammaproteobacteria bacterium]
TNCAIIGRAESFASRNGLLPSLLDAISMGVGFTLLLMLLGGVREIFGFGTLLAQSTLMFGEGAEWMTLTLIDEYRGFLLAILPPGAFIGLGLIIAAKNRIDQSAAAPSGEEILHH